MKKTIICLGVVMSFLTTVCFGAKVDPTKIVVPRNSGRVVETYVSPNPDAPVIAYVQDIHVNYEAQKAEADILEALIRDYGFDLVLKESKGQDSTKDLKKYRHESKWVREQLAERLLKNGEIYGIEYLDLVSDYNFTIQGIENMELLKKETQDQIAINSKAEGMTKLVATLQNITSNLKPHIYTKEMRDLDDKIAAYDKDEIGLVEYVKFLQGVAAANNIEVKAFPNVALFVDSSDLEGQIDFPAVEKERAVAVEAIEKALTEQAKKDEFAAKGLSFRTGEVSQGEFYTYLKNNAESVKVDLTPHKNLTAYTQYITTYEKIDTTLLFKELDSWVDKIKQAMIKTPEQKKLTEISKGIEILSGFANTKLVPDEYNYYVQNKATFDLDGWLKFMKDNSVKFGLTNPVPDDISSLKENIPALERFYGISFDRDTEFIKNIGVNLSKYGKDKAIFIAGGFHTPNMKRLLKEKNYSYIVIAPRVDIVKDYSSIYKERVKEDMDYLTKIMPDATPSIGNKDIISAVEKGDKNFEDGINELRALEQKAATDQERSEIGQAIARLEQGPADTGGVGHICRDYKIKEAVAPRFDTDKVTDEPVVIFTMQHINPDTGEVIGEEEAVIRCSDIKLDTAALSKELTDAGVPSGLQAALRHLATNAGRVLRLEDNRWGLIGFTQPDLMGFADSIGDINAGRLHELVERGLRITAGQPGHISIADCQGQDAANAVIDGTGRTYGQYVAEHGNTQEAQLHAAARAFTFRFFHQQDADLTARIRVAMDVFAAKHPVRKSVDKKFADTKKKTAFQFVVPQGTNKGLEKCETAKNLADSTAFEPSAYGTNVKEMVELARAAVARGVVPLVVLNSEMEQQIDTLSEADKALLASNEIAWLQGDNLNYKIGGKPVFDIMAGALLQVYEGGQTTDIARRKIIAKGLAIEVSALRSDKAAELTADDALKLFPVPGDMNALMSKRATLRILEILAAKPPSRWEIDLRMILTIRSVDLAA